MTNIEQPHIGVAQYNENYNSLDIIIPAKKNWFVIIFLTVWLGGWLIGFLFALGALGFGGFGDVFPGAFLTFWLIGWTVGGIFAARVLVWMVFGKEVITFSPSLVTVPRKALLFSKPKSYDVNHITQIRIIENNHEFSLFANSYQNGRTLIPPGVIHFSYGMKTIKMGSGIDLPEAEQILKTVKSKGYLREQNFNAQ